MTAQQPLAYDAFVGLAAADPAVVGLVLKGSRAHDGMSTRHSDHDLYVVVADDATTDLSRFAGHRTAELDLVVVSLTAFRAAGMPGFERYALSRARIVLDRLDAAESMRLLLELLFALDRRPRPYNKYLEWELARHPLPGWDSDVLLRTGHGEVLDAWGEDLGLMRAR